MQPKAKFIGSVLMVAVLLLSAGGVEAERSAASQARLASAGTGFTYQGLLKNSSGQLVTDVCDFQFTLWDSLSSGAQIGAPSPALSVSVTRGYFMAPVNAGGEFGASAFTGQARWLQVEVKCGGESGYTLLAPRQALTPAPYALALPGLYTQQNITSTNVIGGYSGNNVMAGVVGATIGGGGSEMAGRYHRVTDNFGTIGGGDINWAGNGNGLPADAAYATVCGGNSNTASGLQAAIAGGIANTASGQESFVGGGKLNVASNTWDTIGGGQNNDASGGSATIGGGGGNHASGATATVCGGTANTAGGDVATIAGGRLNIASAMYAAVGGGNVNVASGTGSTVGGGGGNVASGEGAAIGGGLGNVVSGTWAAVGGGWSNIASGNRAVVGGGWNNLASGGIATVSGGTANAATGDYTTIPGGTGAAASRYGQMAYASGTFNGVATGDAQTSVYVLRNTTTNITPTSLYLDGAGLDLTLPVSRTLTFDILVVARSEAGASAGYQIRGVIENAAGTTSLIGTPAVTVLGEDVAAWDVNVLADDTKVALVIQVTGAAGTTIRWVATVHTAEVAW